MPEKDFDVKISDGTTTRRFRLLQSRGRKAWGVRELAPNPQVEGSTAAREGLPVSQMLPFDGQDFSWGSGLKRFSPQTQRPGHSLRYADGFNIDTTEPGIVKHGPSVSTVGTTDTDVQQAIVFNDKVWFMTTASLYSWDGCTLTQEYTECGETFLEMEVFDGNLFVAANTKYFHTDGIACALTEVDVAADHFLALNGVLWRGEGNQISSSEDPADCCPTWTTLADVGDGDSIRNLFSISGLLGVETAGGVFIIDNNLNSIELNKGLRNRRATSTTKEIKSESGSEVWFSDGVDLRRLVAVGFELFDIGPDGPFHTTDDRPVTEFPSGGDIGYAGVTQDLNTVYVVVERSQGNYIYKGKELSRNVFAWTPLVKDATSNTDFIAALKLSSDTQAIVYYNAGTTVKMFDTEWTTFAATWELETCKFNATLAAWDKMWYQINAYVINSDTCNASIDVERRLDTTSGYTDFGTATLASNGSNKITLSTPLSGKEIQLKFVGATCDSAESVDLVSFLLEGLLRPDYRRSYDFTLVADSKEDTTFIEGLRTGTSSFITLTDRFGIDRTVFLLPGYPVEEEIIDDIRKEPVRSYRLLAQELA